MPPPTTGCPTRSSRWRGTSWTASTSAATSACSTPAAAPAASPRSCSRASRTARSSPSTAARRWSSRPRERLGDRVEAFAVDLRRARRHRAVRRDPLDRDLPLDRRPRAAVRAPARGAAAGRPARRPVRRRRQHRQRAGGDRRRRPSRAARLGRPVELRHARSRRRRGWPRPGFTDVWTWLQPWPVDPPDPREYFATVILGSHLERLPAEDERRRSSRPCSPHLDEPVRANYVRLNILART